MATRDRSTAQATPELDASAKSARKAPKATAASSASTTLRRAPGTGARAAARRSRRERDPRHGERDARELEERRALTGGEPDGDGDDRARRADRGGDAERAERRRAEVENEAGEVRDTGREPDRDRTRIRERLPRHEHEPDADKERRAGVPDEHGAERQPPGLEGPEVVGEAVAEGRAERETDGEHEPLSYSACASASGPELACSAFAGSDPVTRL